MNEHPLDLLEKVHHGQPAYPVQSYLGLYSDNHELHLHWHDELELTWVDSGELVYHVDLESVHLCAGDLLLIPSGALHRAATGPGGTCRTRTLVFHPDFLRSFRPDKVEAFILDSLVTGNRHLYLAVRSHHPAHPELMRCFQTALEAHLRKNSGGELQVKGCLFQALALMLGSGPPERDDRARKEGQWVDTARMKVLYSHIELNFSRPLPLEEVAALTNMGVSTFCRFFKSRTGESFVHWLLRFRLDKARHLLQNSSLSIARIAGDTGFGTLAYFSRCFVRAMGEAPSAWRKHPPALRSLSDLAGEGS